MEANHLQAQIMRRVYYSYVLSVLTHSMLWRGVFLGAAGVLLARWLHVASIAQNLLAVPVGNAPKYVFQAFVNAATHGELLTVLITVAATMVGISCVHRVLKAVRFERFFIRTV